MTRKESGERRRCRAIGYLVATRANGLTRWAKSDMKAVPWTLYTSHTRPTIFPDLHAARTAIREAAKYWSAFSRRHKSIKPKTTSQEERRNFYIVRAESPDIQEARHSG